MQAITDLRAPPVVGRFYLVPVIENYPWHGLKRDWPVIGPLHEDAKFFNFGDPHYHIDIRFISDRDFRWGAEYLPHYVTTGNSDADAALHVSATPLLYRGTPLPLGRPKLRRMTCKRAAIRTPLLDFALASREAMEAEYGSPAEPIRRSDGRLLCPHRKADLSSFPPDEHGIVTCPLHGLRVRCGEPA